MSRTARTGDSMAGHCTVRRVGNFHGRASRAPLEPPPWQWRLRVDLICAHAFGSWTRCGIYIVTFLSPSGKHCPFSLYWEKVMLSYEFRFLNGGAFLWSSPGWNEPIPSPLSLMGWGGVGVRGHELIVKSLSLGKWPIGSVWVSAMSLLQWKSWL